jgi:hypothetical protein
MSILLDRRFVVLAEILIFNVTLLLWVQPQGFFPQFKSLWARRILTFCGLLSLVLLLGSSFWTAVVISR